MNSKDILVLGNHAQRDLMQSLSRVGFVPQVWGSMRHTLDKLLHQRFAAIIVDRKFTNADVLEFILNVRDINKEIPVVVIGSGNDERIDIKISELGRTTILNGSERDNKLGDKLIQVLKCSEKEDV
jgi:FixJ family two-component response regulator